MSSSQFGPYTLLECLRRGPVSEVHHATEPRAVGEPRSVILRRLAPELAKDSSAVSSFLAAAELARSVTHPNVVSILDLGVHEGVPYVSLEHVPSLDLGRLLAHLRRHQLSLGTGLAVHIALEMLAGLEAIHATCRVAHGRVTPNHILLSAHGEVKLSPVDGATMELTARFPAVAASSARAWLGYGSPEHVTGQTIGPRSDVFATASVLGELLTGVPVFGAATELATLLAVRDANLGAFPARAATLPPALIDAVIRGLSRDPEDRPASALQFADLVWGASPFHEASAARAELVDVVAEALRAAQSERARSRAPFDSNGAQRAFVAIKPSGERTEPLTFAALVEAVRTGMVSRDDRISEGPGNERAVTDWPELARHLPAAVAPDAHRADRIESGGVPRLFAAVWLERETGLALCSQGTTRKEVYFVDGVPTFVQSNLASELLGEFLLQRGAISRGELDMALAMLPRFEGRLGETLIGLGLLEPIALFRLIAAQVHEKLLDLFTWESGSIAFHSGQTHAGEGFPIAIDAWSILIEGVRRRVAARFPMASDTAVQTVRPAPRGLARAPLTALQRTVLERSIAGATVGELLSGMPRDPRDPARGMRDVALLLALGALQQA